MLIKHIIVTVVGVGSMKNDGKKIGFFFFVEIKSVCNRIPCVIRSVNIFRNVTARWQRTDENMMLLFGMFLRGPVAQGAAKDNNLPVGFVFGEDSASARPRHGMGGRIASRRISRIQNGPTAIKQTAPGVRRSELYFIIILIFCLNYKSPSNL